MVDSDESLRFERRAASLTLSAAESSVGSESSAGVLHACDRRLAITWVMFRRTADLAIAAATIAAVAMITACGSNSAGSSSSSGHLSQAQIQQELRDLVRFADCMRTHGVPDIPDPTTSPRQFKISLSPSTAQSPAFHSAETACHQLLPGGGPHSPSAGHSQAQIAAILAFARCMRGHGFPSFPDPTSTGLVTREMLANAGINLHQPAVLPAADACVSVTHGLITTSDVARFVAGGTGS
jgi:hypothetical protein